MEDCLNFNCKLIKVLSGAELKVIKNDHTGWFNYLEQFRDLFYRGYVKHIERQIKQLNLQANCIYEIKIIHNIYITCFCDNKNEFTYLLTPMLNEPFSENKLRALLHHSKISKSVIQEIINFASSLPVVPIDTSHRLAILLFQHICGENTPVASKNIDLMWEIPNETFEERNTIQTKDIWEIENRYEFSKLLTEAVKQGNYSLAVQIMGKSSSNPSFAVRNSSPLRNMQNFCIIANTQMRHTLEDSAIHPYKLDQLSNTIGLQVEQLKSVDEAQRFMQKIIRQYCSLVQEYTFPNLPPLVHLTVTYIKDHVTENITVKDTAGKLMVNANYLSTVFRKFVGISFIDFLNRERVRQAAGLLRHSNLQIQQIATLVGYNNTSYFDKMFYKEYKQSPLEYRNKPML